MLMSRLMISVLGASLLTQGYGDTSIPSINDMMSIEDQNKTGVIKLNQKQKMELAKWLVEHRYYEDIASEQELHALTVSLNVYDGKIIQLSDNSVWEIAPDDLVISQTWLSSIPIKITDTSNPDYPYLLTNLRNNQSIKAKKGHL